MRKAKPNVAVEKSEGRNRAAMNATIIGPKDSMIKKAATDPSETAAMPNDGRAGILSKERIIEPPYDKLVLAQLSENNTELGQCVAAMEVNIEGFGGRLVQAKMSEELKEKLKEKIEAERKQIRTLLLSVNPDMDLTALCRRKRVDQEMTGEAYWELVPQRGDATKIGAINHIESHTIVLTPQDEKFVEITKRILDVETGETIEKKHLKRFRRFIQRRNAKTIYFKEWGDPRILHKETGKFYTDEATAKASDDKFDAKKHAATSLLHFRLYSPRTPYGLPRFIGNLFSIFGSRAAEEVNWNTFQNNNVPSMAVLVSGNAMLTEGTIKRIEEFTEYVTKRDKNYSKFLVLESEPATEGLTNSGTAKVEIIPLANVQHKDQLFQEYDKNNSDKVRRSFRLPPIFVGKSDDYTRATAESSRKLADEQVFGPERQETDRKITDLFRDMGWVYWEYKSFGPNVTDDTDLVSILNGTEKTGALTPNLAREVLSDILNKDLPPYKKEVVGFDPDIPFSLTMAEAVKGIGALGGNPSTGALAPNQGQVPAAQPVDPNAPPAPAGTPAPAPVNGDPLAAQTQQAVQAGMVLNGAQMQAVVQMVTDVATGQIPFDSAISVLVIGLGMSQDTANKILQPAVGFKPEPLAEDRPPQQNIQQRLALKKSNPTAHDIEIVKQWEDRLGDYAKGRVPADA